MKYAALAFGILATPLTAQDTDLAQVGGVRDQLTQTDQDHAACLAQLKDLVVTFTEIDLIIPTDDRDCDIVRPEHHQNHT